MCATWLIETALMILKLRHNKKTVDIRYFTVLFQNTGLEEQRTLRNLDQNSKP